MEGKGREGRRAKRKGGKEKGGSGRGGRDGKSVGEGRGTVPPSAEA